MERAGDEVWAIVVAGGRGARFGGPKQFAPLGGRTVLEHSTAAARGAAGGVVVVVPPDAPLPVVTGADVVVPGGATRSESVRSGLASVPGHAGIVVVHDAARPLAGTGLFRRVIDAVRGGADGATTAVGVTDTLRRRDGGVVDRDELVSVQTPQAFRATALRRAHAAGGEATDDAGLVEASGGRIVTVEGDRWNLKVTAPEDLVVAEALLAAREGRGAEVGT